MDTIIVIADDLTGAADTGVQFGPFFDETVLVPYHRLSKVLGTASGSLSQATAVYTNSRALAAHAARQRLSSIGRRLRQLKSALIYKKVDSCLRGNLGAETETLMDELDFELSFVAPALPEMGRITREDIHQVHGVPVGQSEISKDPLTPVTESRLSRIMAAQSRYPVDHVALDLLEGTEIQLHTEIERMVSRGIRHVVFDATARGHLDKIGRLIFSSFRKILPVGSAGLAAGLGCLLPRKPVCKEHEKRPSDPGNRLLVSGTAAEITRRQIEILTETYPYKEVVLDAENLADRNQRHTLLKKSADVRSVLAARDVIIRIESPRNDDVAVKRSQRLRMAKQIVETLGLFVASVVKDTRPGLLFVTGGDTADAVLAALEATGIQILGEVVSGVVRGRLTGGAMEGLALITKAGAFGQRDTLVGLHEIWQKNKEKTDEH